MPLPDNPHDVVVFVYDGVELLDATGPINVLSAAARMTGGGYRLHIVSVSGGLCTASGGVSLMACGPSEVPAAFHTLVVPGSLALSYEGVDTVRALAGRAQRVVGVCTGALLLARAGLLRGRRATTHWAATDSLTRLEPTCEVVPDAIFVRDGAVWTSAGVTAGLDLALALVESDRGAELAESVARWLVMPRRRFGGQSQHAPFLTAKTDEPGPLGEVIRWALDHLDEDLPVSRLARRAAMSPRNFTRRFKEETGQSPAAWVQGRRIDRARELLQASSEPIHVVASACGFASTSAFHRAFVRSLGLSPSAFRQMHAR